MESRSSLASFGNTMTRKTLTREDLKDPELRAALRQIKARATQLQRQQRASGGAGGLGSGRSSASMSETAARGLRNTKKGVLVNGESTARGGGAPVYVRTSEGYRQKRRPGRANDGRLMQSTQQAAGAQVHPERVQTARKSRVVDMVYGSEPGSSGSAAAPFATMQATLSKGADGSLPTPDEYAAYYSKMEAERVGRETRARMATQDRTYAPPPEPFESLSARNKQVRMTLVLLLVPTVLLLVLLLVRLVRLLTLLLSAERDERAASRAHRQGFLLLLFTHFLK